MARKILRKTAETREPTPWKRQDEEFYLQENARYKNILNSSKNIEFVHLSQSASLHTKMDSE
jgi:DICT domain-containing protein